jgi:signal recognition particle subunit SRP72
MGKPTAAAAQGGEADGHTDVTARLASLFAVLEEALRGFALQKALHTCDQILALAPEDEDALRAKAATFIHADRSSDALALLALHPALAAQMPFERAYCLYRAARHAEALALLDECGAQLPPDQAAGATHLRAQLQYRAGAFDDCIATYEAALQARGARASNRQPCAQTQR